MVAIGLPGFLLSMGDGVPVLAMVASLILLAPVHALVLSGQPASDAAGE